MIREGVSAVGGGGIEQEDERKSCWVDPVGWQTCSVGVASLWAPPKSSLKLLNAQNLSSHIPGQNHSDAFRATGITGSWCDEVELWCEEMTLQFFVPKDALECLVLESGAQQPWPGQC